MGITQILESQETKPIFSKQPKLESKTLNQLTSILDPKKSEFHIPKDLVEYLDEKGQQRLKDIIISLKTSKDKKDSPQLGMSYFLFEFISQINGYIKSQSQAKNPTTQGKKHLIELWHPLEDSLEEFFYRFENLKIVVDEKKKKGVKLSIDESREFQNLYDLLNLFGDFLSKKWKEGYNEIKGKIGEYHVEKLLEEENLLYIPRSLDDEDFDQLKTQLDALGVDFIIDNGKIFLLDVKVGDKEKLKKESENIIFDTKNIPNGKNNKNLIETKLGDKNITKLGYKIKEPKNSNDIEKTLEQIVSSKINGKIQKIYIYIDEQDFDLMGFENKEKVLQNIKQILEESKNIGLEVNIQAVYKPQGRKILLRRKK